MRNCLFQSIATAIVLAAGLTAAPTRAADATLSRRCDAPGLVATAIASVRPRTKTIAVSDLPNEPRSVVMVYQAETGASPNSIPQ